MTATTTAPAHEAAPARELSEGVPAPTWTEQVARWGGRVLQLYAAWLVLALVLRPVAGPAERPVAEVLSVTNVPSYPSLFSAVVVGLVASGFLRRRRVALWFVVLVWQLPSALVMLVAIVLDRIDPTAGVLDDVHWTAYVGGVVGLVLTVVLVAARRAFPARIARGAWWAAGLVLVVGLALAAGTVWSLLQVVPSTLDTQAERAGWALSVSVGLSPHEEPFSIDGGAPGWLALVGGLVAGAALLLAVVVFLRTGPRDAPRSPDEELAVRRLLLEHPSDDSLEYFATRDDRDAIFSVDGRAAVSYRVVSGVLLAAGDPLGDPASWPDAIGRTLAYARRHGWAPGVVSASEKGARAYRDAGLAVLTMGDEAIVETREFDLAAPSMRSVRHAVARPRREGYTVRLRRQREIPADELAALARAADAWRHGDDERGFSMALERLGSPRDPRVLVVTAHDRDGEPRGLLTFVPWGRKGVSLDYMRRSPDALPGVTELMVSTLASEGAGMAIDRVSLNFAMFRGLIEQGESVAASPWQRFLRRLVLAASRWWQLDQLYRSNQKYEPRWRTRYLCYAAPAQLTAVTVAAGQAEGFVPVWRSSRETLAGAGAAAALGQAVREQEDELLALDVPTQRLTDQERARRAKLDVLARAGMPAYPVAVPRTHRLADVDELLLGRTVSVSGRVVRLRDLGGVAFAVLREENHERQVMLTAEGAADLALWRRTVDLADHVSVTGTVTRSRTGELSVHADSWVMASKSLKAPPDKFRGLADPEARMRLRHVDLALDTASSVTLRGRSAAVHSLRSSLVERGFIEVETPILQRVHGGANARPFRTHINAYDMDLYLRIAPELFLKQLAIGGIERVFELGRNFRNEGADATHNPEFTSLEAYQAFGDYTTMRHLTRELVVAAAVAVHGDAVSRRPDGSEVRLDGEWPVVTVHDAVSRAVGAEVTPDTPEAELHALCARFGIEVAEDETHGAVVNEMYDRLVEGQTVEPTFYTDFPVETSPLTRGHRHDPRLAERWDLVAFGAELGTAYSELIDPIDQRERFTQQSLLAAAGDPEAMEIDEDFLSALEFAMPPTGGLGLGVDRIYMTIIGASIRETLAFPFVKPQRRS
ncbi:bifunctional lysylphosphatidylglycerol synthetase/lysine--tRNA ligase LysX [Cellulosimicrobium cellulans]|uniref:bifunctional lysylphosphatidylglycerol synthetase/lysine--tRNA ligase LysX n=1 Tax=Cellulosimicrobium cellulans TaxID=1710 RepID=UPI0019627B39|nr:bifunctional lysylphosphatidylglycerol synthetase/lysine--tRNA ligase LysX [Cellulosimicrobium cellulans]MBN0038893.1 bifunctional lysylphosphatidylglycerol synthetase/lysine--tRNA ligase LysX [Cellulosimicrobium cellulans]